MHVNASKGGLIFSDRMHEVSENDDKYNRSIDRCSRLS